MILLMISDLCVGVWGLVSLRRSNNYPPGLTYKPRLAELMQGSVCRLRLPATIYRRVFQE
jgi:hypothetical protein